MTKSQKNFLKKIELGKPYKGFFITQNSSNSAKELDRYGKGLNTKSALEFIKTVIDRIDGKPVNFNEFALFYSGYQGFIINDHPSHKKGVILFSGPWYTLEDYGPGDGWYIETNGKKSYGLDDIVEELLKIK